MTVSSGGPEIQADIPPLCPPTRAILVPLVLVLAGLPLLDCLVHGESRLFRYIAADAFYYFTVAANFPATHLFTFDQARATNGFHPAWQALLAGVFVALGGSGDPRGVGLWVGWLLGLALLTAGVALLAARAMRFLGGAGVLLLLLPCGALAVLEGPYHPRYGAFWNYANGMESGLLVFLFALLALALLRDDSPAGRPWLASGALLGCVVLGRLDSVFVFPAFASVVWLEARWRPGPERAVLRRGLTVALLAGGAIVAGYLAWNLWTAGTLWPVSGRIKSGFPRVSGSNLRWWRTLPASLLWNEPQDRIHAWRLVLLTAPMTVCGAHLAANAFAWARGRRRGLPFGPVQSPWERFLLMSSLFVVMLHGHNLLFVDLMSQGHWYTPVSHLAAGLIVIHWVGRIRGAQRLLCGRPLRTASAGALLIAAQVLYFLAVFFADRPIQQRLGIDFEEDRDRYYRAFSDRFRVRDFYGGTPPAIVDLDDGINAYTLGGPALSGLGFCLDAEAFRLTRMGRRPLLQLAWERGFERVATCQNLSDPILYSHPDPERITEFLHATPFYLDFKPFVWEVEYVPPGGAYCVMRFRPAGPTPQGAAREPGARSTGSKALESVDSE